MGATQETKDWPEILGERVRLRRVALGWTQEQLADRVRGSIRHLRDIEGGKVNLSVERLIELAFALGVSPSELVDGFLPSNAPLQRILWPSLPRLPRKDRRRDT